MPTQVELKSDVRYERRSEIGADPRYVMVPRHLLANYGVTYSTPQINRMVCEGTFPVPLQVSARRVAWRLSDLMSWVDRLPIATLKHPDLPGRLPLHSLEQQVSK